MANKLAFKSVKSIEDKIGDYLDLVESGERNVSYAGLARKMGISTRTFWEYARGLVPSAPPEVTAKFQDIALLVQDYLELALMGVRGGRNAGPGAKFLLSNYCGMSDKASVEVDGGLSIYKQIEENADRSVEELRDELAIEIAGEIANKDKGGK